MKLISFLILFSLSSTTFATNDDFNLPALDLRQGQLVSGNLANLVILPYQGKTIFYVIGTPAAELQWNKLQIKLTLSREIDSASIPLAREFGGFVYEGVLNINESKLQISAPNIQPETIFLNGRP